ncbi:MAG: DUF2254 domain-containing protein [Bdellovibrionota bacterium]
MKAWIQQLLDRIRTSLWFTPACMGFFAVCLGIFIPRLNLELDWEKGDLLRRWFNVSHDQARLILSTISGALVTVAGTVFSITVVTLSVSSQQFGSRLLRAYQRDRATQVSIGCLLSTALYSILVLRSVKTSLPVPVVAVLLALVLAVLSMGLLIFFVHHVAYIIQAPAVIAMVCRDLGASLSATFPEKKKGEETRDLQKRLGSIADGLGTAHLHISAHSEGYIQGMDYETVLEAATQSQTVIEVLKRPGDFHIRGDTLFSVYGKAELPKKTIKHLQSALSTGHRRTTVQDAECGINELVEVAVRALSPGVNDPFTAMNCLDYLGAYLCMAATLSPQPKYLHDKDENLRVILRTFTLAGLIDAAFNQIRQYGQGSVAVSIRVLEVLERLLKKGCEDPARDAILQHAEMVVEDLSQHCTADTQAIRDRYERILAQKRFLG